MRPKSVILLVVALGCGLVASIGINQMLSARNVEKGETGPKITVFIAKTKIGIGDTLKPDNVNLVEYPPENVPPDAITKLEDIQGRRAKAPIHPGLPIVAGQLLAKGENGEDVSTLIPLGMRLAPVRVDAVSGMAGLVKPGDRVDVVVHLRENPSIGLLSAKTLTFLQNVKVVAVDEVFRRDNDGQQSVVAKTISFILTPDQAEALTTATELGSVRLTMRGAGDESITETKGVSARELFGQQQETPTQPPLPVELQRIPPPLPVEPTPIGTETPKNIFKMRIFDGATPREVTFEDGEPLDLTSLNSSNPTAPAPSGATKP